jgi:hypothetical protein
VSDQNLMKACRTISDRAMPTRQHPTGNPVCHGIPIHFPTGSPYAFQIKMQPPMPMNPVLQTMTVERPLIPGLFQIAACAGGPEPTPVFQDVPALGKTPFAEMMLNPKKLEAILKTIARLEKTAARRVSSRLARISRVRPARAR